MERRRLQQSLETLTAAAPVPWSLWRAAVGLLALESAVAGMILLAAHPPQRPVYVELDLGPPTVPPRPDPRTIPGVPSDPRPYVIVDMGLPDLPELGLAGEMLPRPATRNERLARLPDRRLHEPHAVPARLPDALLALPGMAGLTEEVEPTPPAADPVPLLPALELAETLPGPRPAAAEVWSRPGPPMPDEPRPSAPRLPDALPPAAPPLLPEAGSPVEAEPVLLSRLNAPYEPPLAGPMTAAAEALPPPGPGIPVEMAAIPDPLPDPLNRAGAGEAADPVMLVQSGAESLSATGPQMREPLAASPVRLAGETLRREPRPAWREVPAPLVARADPPPLPFAGWGVTEAPTASPRRPDPIPSRQPLVGEAVAFLPPRGVSEPLIAGRREGLETIMAPLWPASDGVSRLAGPMLVPEQSPLPGDLPDDGMIAPLTLVQEIPPHRPAPAADPAPPPVELALADPRTRAPRPRTDGLTPPSVGWVWRDERPWGTRLAYPDSLTARGDPMAALRDLPAPRQRLDALVQVTSLRLTETASIPPVVRDIDLSGFRALRMFDVAPDGLGHVAERPAATVPHGAARDVRRFATILKDLDFSGGSPLSVPGFFLHRLPADLAQVEQAEHKKKLFLRAILPHILHANERILYLRRQVIDLAPGVQSGDLSADQVRQLTEILDEVGLERWDFLELMRRLDVVPPSLALAQAAEETGWGTSSMAVNGNALFGQVQWVRDKGKVVREQRPFDGLHDGVLAYVRNLNTHWAYDAFRHRRAQMRTKGQTPNGLVLINELEKYSERGRAYQNAIRTLIVTNGLLTYDRARFRLEQQMAEDMP